jgi:hypothetical protein
MKTFSDFIKAARVTETPRGDFIADTKTLINCNKFPDDFKNWGELYHFMISRHACEPAITEARKVWRQYRKSLTLEDVLS